MATSEDPNKLPKQFRPRSGAAVLNITTPEVQPNLGKPQRDSAKKMLVNVQEEGAKTLGKKQRRAQLDNPVVDPNIDKKMLKRGIYNDIERNRSATFASLTTTQSWSTSALLPPAQVRRTSLPYTHRDPTIHHPSVNGSPQKFICHELRDHSPGRSLDSGVVMEVADSTLTRPQMLSNSLDDLTEQHPQTNTTQVQFPLSLANNVTSGGTTVQGCCEHFDNDLTKHGECIVCDVLHNEPLLINDTVSEREHNRDSGVGNELQLNVLPNVTPMGPMMLTEMLPSPSKGLGLSRSTELPSAESHSMDLRSSLREKDFFETTNDLEKVRKFSSKFFPVLNLFGRSQLIL